MQTGEIVRTERFPGSHFIHPVNRPGSNCIFGLSLDGGKRSAAFYDLTMRYFRNSGGDRVVTTGVLPIRKPPTCCAKTITASFWA